MSDFPDEVLREVFGMDRQMKALKAAVGKAIQPKTTQPKALWEKLDDLRECVASFDDEDQGGEFEIQLTRHQLIVADNLDQVEKALKDALERVQDNRNALLLPAETREEFRRLRKNADKAWKNAEESKRRYEQGTC